MRFADDARLRRDLRLGQILARQFLRLGLPGARGRQKFSSVEKERRRARRKHHRRDPREIEETQPHDGLSRRVLLAREIVADHDVAARADQGPLPAEQRTVRRQEQITRRREVLFLAHPQDQRHENQHDGRVIDEHRGRRRHRQHRRLQQQFVPRTQAKQPRPQELRRAGAHDRPAEHEHGNHHHHRHAAEAREPFLIREDAAPLAVRVWPRKNQRQRHQQRGHVRPQFVLPEEVQRGREDQRQGNVVCHRIHGGSLRETPASCQTESARSPLDDDSTSLLLEARDGSANPWLIANSGEILGGACVRPVGGE